MNRRRPGVGDLVAGGSRPRVRACGVVGALGMLALAASSLAGQQPGDTARAPAAGQHEHGDTLRTPVYALPSITVTAARTERQTPASAVDVPRARVEQSLATSGNAWDLLRQAAGVEVHEQGQGPGFASDASVRGFSSDHSTDLALWVDGVPINEPVNGHAEGYNDWSLLFPQAVQDMQVIKGPSSSLFGDFAMAGVVNVRTLERMPGTGAWLSGGSSGRREGALLTGVDRPGTGVVLGVRGQADDGWRPHAGWKLLDGYGRWVRDLSPATSVDLGADLYATGWDSPGFLTAEQFANRLYDTVTNPTDGGSKVRGQERASVRVLLGGGVLWRTTVYATQGRWSLFLTTPPEGGQAEGSGSQTEEQDRRWGAGLTSALTFDMPRSEITIGTQDRLEHADYQNWWATARTRDSARTLVSARQRSGGLFLESVTDAGRHVRISAGGRLDLFDNRAAPLASVSASSAGQATPASAYKAILSPKLGVLWHLPRLVSVYADVARGYRQSNGVITEPRLPLITEWAYEAGLKLDAAWGDASLAYYRMDVSNEQSFNPITLESSSGGASRRQGAELEGNLRAGRAVTLTADLTVNDARYRAFITQEGDTLDGARVFNTARYVASGSVELAPPGAAWHARVATNVLGPYTPFDEAGLELPAYGLVHLSGGATIARIRVDAGVRNVLNRAYPELRAGGFVSPGQPRAVYVTLSRKFGRQARPDGADARSQPGPSSPSGAALVQSGPAW